MSPDDEPSAEDPDLVAERIISCLGFLIQTAHAYQLTYLIKPLVRCEAASQEGYVKDRRRRYYRTKNGSGS